VNEPDNKAVAEALARLRHSMELLVASLLSFAAVIASWTLSLTWIGSSILMLWPVGILVWTAPKFRRRRS